MVLGGYLVGVAVLYCTQRRLLYGPPTRSHYLDDGGITRRRGSGWLLLDQFRSDRRMKAVTAPILLLRGVRDQVVPIAFGERLFGLANDPKRFVRYPDRGHIDLDAFGAGATALRFIVQATR